MAAEVTIAGENFALTLVATAYERPDARTGADANWLKGEARLAFGRAASNYSSNYSATQTVSLYTDDLRRFRDELRPLLESLSGEATLHHIESQLGCRVVLTAGAGTLSAYLREHVGPEFEIKEIRTDQSYLQQTLHDLELLLERFPVRGVPH